MVLVDKNNLSVCNFLINVVTSEQIRSQEFLRPFVVFILLFLPFTFMFLSSCFAPGRREYSHSLVCPPVAFNFERLNRHRLKPDWLLRTSSLRFWEKQLSVALVL